MERDYRKELEGRILNRLWQDEHRNGEGEPPIVGIMRDVDVYTTLAEREAFTEGCLYSGAAVDANGVDRTPSRRRQAAVRYPLPKRTRQVLREEPDPDGMAAGFRVRNGILEARDDRFPWRALDGSQQIGYHISPARIRLWANLLANPYRTEEVEADESNPWGDE